MLWVAVLLLIGTGVMLFPRGLQFAVDYRWQRGVERNPRLATDETWPATETIILQAQLRSSAGARIVRVVSYPAFQGPPRVFALEASCAPRASLLAPIQILPQIRNWKVGEPRRFSARLDPTNAAHAVIEHDDRSGRSHVIDVWLTDDLRVVLELRASGGS
jgi:hypothetical protein